MSERTADGPVHGDGVAADGVSYGQPAGRAEDARPSGPAGYLRQRAASAMAALPQWRRAKVFLLVTFVDAAGRGLFLTGSALFYTQTVGLTTTQVGLGLSLAGLAGVICAVPIGRIADRFGARPTLIGLQVWRAVAFFLYPLVSTFQEFVAIACVVGAAEWAVGPIIQAVAGAIAADDSFVGTMAMVTVVRNVGYAVSALIATVVIATGNPVSYAGLVLATAAAFLVTAVLLARLRLPRTRPAEGSAGGRRPRRLLIRNYPFLLLTCANGILYLHATILSVTLPLWIVTRTSAPKALVGAILVVNTFMAVTLQIRLSRGGDDVAVAARKQRKAGLALAACCALAAVTGLVGSLASSLILVTSIVALTLAEIWQSAGAWGLSYGLSPASSRNLYLSFYSLGATGLTVVGPGLLAVSVLNEGPVGWAWLGGVFAMTGIAVPFLARAAAS